ncbi:MULTISPECIES: hypothetical protein [Streptomycetaceae]|uniref:Mce-associated membrane protein n=1 Tax=Streptantibioticus cattleyicolor (strain ATCC 35852 / DSM 46488 / JCM 4925 / NBRC 14057 / NRRL 8057) TaxID=1003195 RepID=F8JUH7_STREN|nr:MULTISPECIES: hypothetical protein [Streptomycetaceae]AEW95599.1 hypothetical protein SCATT_32280 [Streptantibioticus cattleyicolor NRRL 8057 = DSM 46488]MYS60149.1 hypothetical protein [Streptomyces sp. SID5468]CCB75936.1 conserved exported protein of unknown function [Streptantibioticus cattleyicolor NRRL 8057 = DSM 46488]
MGRWTRRGPLPLVAAWLAVLAAVAAGWAGWTWYAAAHDTSAAYAATRDQALAAGEQAVLNLNTLDHDHIDQGLDTWDRSTTGDLRSQLAQGRAEFTKQVRQAGTTTSAKVLSGALTELDDHAGKATVMIALRLTVRTGGGQPVIKDSRMLGELARTPQGWKLSALGQAPTGDTADPSAAPATP